MKKFTIVRYAACVLLLLYGRTVMCNVYIVLLAWDCMSTGLLFTQCFEKNDDTLIKKKQFSEK